MIEVKKIKREFKKQGGILKTAELKYFGLSSRQIKRLQEDGIILKVKSGFYELVDYTPHEEVAIARLFPKAVIFLESALMHYEYTDRIPTAWQIAVNKHIEKSQYKTKRYIVEPYYLEPKFIDVGINEYQLDGVSIKIYDRERTICDVIRYEKNLKKRFSQMH